MPDRAQDGKSDPTSYELMLRLEALESLLEEIEEWQESRNGAPESAVETASLPDDLREQMDELGVTSIDDVKAEISSLNAQLDRVE